jgi:EAL and modified HD-GYP domain-containing signal transduction protein
VERGVGNVVVGRQPIFDRRAVVHGYEVRCRPPAGGPVAAGADVAQLVTSLVSGIDHLVGHRDVYLTVDRELLTFASAIALPPERTVLQIDPADVDDDVVHRVRELRAQGFRIAVDHTVADRDPAGLFDLASTVKVDVRTADQAAAEELVRRAARAGKSAVATNIDLRQELTECDRMGFDLFQGDLLCRPALVEGHRLDPGRATMVRLAASLLDGEVAIEVVEDIVRSDPALAHQLMGLAGVGAAGGLRRTVRTVREALVLVGWRRLQSWVALLMLAGAGTPSHPEEITVALVRARACELVAASVAPSASDMAFAAGMLSAFDLLLHVPLTEALAGLPLDPVLSAAVLERQGTLGAVVSDVEDRQFGRTATALRSGVDEGGLQRALFEALVWSVGATEAVTASAS